MVRKVSRGHLLAMQHTIMDTYAPHGDGGGGAAWWRMVVVVVNYFKAANTAGRRHLLRSRCMVKVDGRLVAEGRLKCLCELRHLQ